MIDFFMLMLFPFLDFLPFQIPRYWLFREKLRIPMRAVVAMLIGVTAVYSAVFLWMDALGALDQAVSLLRYGFMLFATLISFFLIKDSITKNLYTLLLMISYSFFLFGNANFVEAHFFADFSGEHPYLVYNGLRLLLLLATYPFFLHFLNHTVREALSIQDKIIWKYMWIIPLFSTLFGMLYCTVTDVYAPATWQFLASRYLMLGGSCYVTFVLLKILKGSEAYVRLEENLRSAGRFLAAQKKQYEALSRHMEEIRRARHDLRQHVSIVQSYIDRDDHEGLREYVRQYREAAPLDAVEPFCQNHVVNTVVCYYGELARQQGVSFAAEME